jgi:hypothetical protein
MADSRLNLHAELCGLLDNINVYYNPPESVKLKYPCIKYSKSGTSTKRANNAIYKFMNRYEVIVIDTNPDSNIGDILLHRLPMCNFDRSYKSDNLLHNVYTLYY